MVKLTKIKSPEWLGNGFGTSNAIWAVKGHEHIHCWSLGFGEWRAIDSSDDENKRIISYAPKHIMLEKVAQYINNGAAA